MRVIFLTAAAVLKKVAGDFPEASGGVIKTKADYELIEANKKIKISRQELVIDEYLKKSKLIMRTNQINT
jgi:hypothetical protein